MTPDPMHARLRMLLTVCAVCLEDRGQDAPRQQVLGVESNPERCLASRIFCQQGEKQHGQQQRHHSGTAI